MYQQVRTCTQKLLNGKISQLKFKKTQQQKIGVPYIWKEDAK